MDSVNSGTKFNQIHNAKKKLDAKGFMAQTMEVLKKPKADRYRTKKKSQFITELTEDGEKNLMLSASSNSERSTIFSKINATHGRNRSTTFVPRHLIYSNQEKAFLKNEASTKLTSNQIELRANNKKDSKDRSMKLHIQIKKENGTLHL